MLVTYVKYLEILYIDSYFALFM